MKEKGVNDSMPIETQVRRSQKNIIHVVLTPGCKRCRKSEMMVVILAMPLSLLSQSLI